VARGQILRGIERERDAKERVLEIVALAGALRGE
jgi:hypothetical protein